MSDMPSINWTWPNPLRAYDQRVISNVKINAKLRFFLPIKCSRQQLNLPIKNGLKTPKVSLIILLVNSDRQPLNHNSFLSHDGNCLPYSYPDNLSRTYVNSKVHSREAICQSPSKHIVNGLAGDTICQVGKQGYLVDQADTTLLYCTRI